MAERQLDSTELLNRQGGELKSTSQGYKTVNTQPNFVSPTQGSEQQTITEQTFAGIAGTKFDVAVAFFESKGVPKTLARTYGAVLLETSKRTGKDITELVQVTSSNKLTFKDDSLTHINVFRSKTSQIGYRENISNTTNEFVLRNIVV